MGRRRRRRGRRRRRRHLFSLSSRPPHNLTSLQKEMGRKRETNTIEEKGRKKRKLGRLKRRGARSQFRFSRDEFLRQLVVQIYQLFCIFICGNGISARAIDRRLSVHLHLERPRARQGLPRAPPCERQVHQYIFIIYFYFGVNLFVWRSFFCRRMKTGGKSSAFPLLPPPLPRLSPFPTLNCRYYTL